MAGSKSSPANVFLQYATLIAKFRRIPVLGDCLSWVRGKTVPLDRYISSHPSPDFLKCDVEGAEVEVFEGADRLLREKRPVLLVEMHSSENHAQLRSKFRQLGYVCRDLDENHLLALPQ